MKHSSKDLLLLFKLENSLGSLERQVMLLIWKMGKVNVRQALKVLRAKRNFAYTTIMTVMDKLYKKGFLKREKIGKAYWYAPSVKENTLITNSLSWVFKDLAANYGRKKVLIATLALVPTFSNKLITTYKRPILLSFSFILIFAFLIYSLFDLWQNLHFFGVIDYLQILLSGVVFNFDHLRLIFLALGESLPLINILTAIILLLLTINFGKKLFKLSQLRRIST